VEKPVEKCEVADVCNVRFDEILENVKFDEMLRDANLTLI